MYPKILLKLLILVKLSQCSQTVNETEDGTLYTKSSLAFVFDTTGSMYDDLEQLRKGAEMILKTALEEGNVIGDFVFVPFHDPVVGPATVTQDKEVFKNALEMVRVYGGGDCPEKSLGGIQLALDVSQARSYVYVFTDATAGDHRLIGKVLDAVQRRQSQVVFVLTGHCNDLDKPSFKVYKQIAAASSGQVFNLNKTSVHKVLDFVKSSIKGRMVNLGSSFNPPGSNTQEIPVDSTLGEVTVSVSGAKPQITVVDPSGEQLTGPPKLITTLDLSEIMVVKVMQPEPGNWTITVGSDEEYSVKVSGLSNLTFNHGFSVEKPKDMAETSYRPLKGTYNHMMLSLTQRVPASIDFAEILSMNGSTLFELPLTEVDAEKKVYLAEAFIPPDEEFFYIAINGKDEYNQPLRRIGTTAVQAKVPDVPYLATSKKITAYAHSRVVLKCKVESLVPVIAMWTKGSHKLQPQISSLQTTTIEYVIEDIKEENTGIYKCFAKNVAGISKVTTEVTLIVEPPQVSIEPANKTLKVGENITLTCSVFSEALLSDFLFISNTRKANGIEIIEPNNEGIYVFNKTIQNAGEADSGTYTCSATNKGGSHNQSTTITVQSKPTAQILGPNTISRTYHTIVELQCHVDNCNGVKWVHNRKTVQQTSVYGSGTDILKLNVTDDGTWLCVAERGFSKASDSVKITVLIKPSVSIVGEKNITILNGTTHELVCEVNANPPPRILWHRETEEFLNHTITQSKINTYTSTLTLNSSIENIEATYFCYGENSEGITQDSVQVNVRRKMTVVKGLKDISEELYHPVLLNCLVDSHPPALTSWRHNGTLLHSTANIQISDDNSSVTIKRLSFDDLGMFSCEADNGQERVELNATLSVHGLESPSIRKEPAKIIASKGESTLITCSVIKSSPSPTISWKFKSSSSDTFSDLNISSAELNITARVQDQGVYRCAAHNEVGSDTYDVEMVVQYPPQLKPSDTDDVNGTLEVEDGDEVKLSCGVIGAPLPIVMWAKDGLPVKFSKNIHLTGDHLVINKATEYDSGYYICNATSSMGTVGKNFTLFVYVAPKITSEITTDETPALETLEGQLVELPCEAKGAPKPMVTWEQNGVIINDERKLVDEFGIRFIANLTDFGNYTCKAKNKYGNTSVTYSVYVWVPPSIEPPLKSTKDVLLGDDVSLQCDIVGFPIPIVKWVFENMLEENTTDISFNEVGNLYIHNASSKHEGTYICVAENLAGIANKLFNLNVNEPPKILDDNYTGPYLATNLDSAVVIACKATGKPKPYIVWSKDDVYLHKDSQYEVRKDGSLTIKSPMEDMSGNYTCTAKNKFGDAKKTIAVEVYSLPTLEQAEESQSKATVLERENATIDCPIRANHDDTVKWYKDAELVTTGRLRITNVSRDHQATYACVVTNAIGSAYSTVNIDVEWPPDFVDDTEEGDLKNNGIIDSDNRAKELTETDQKINEVTEKNLGIKVIEVNETSDTIDIKKNDNDIINDEKNNGLMNGKNVGSKKMIDNNMQSVTRHNVDSNIEKGNKDIRILEVVRGDDAYLDCQTNAKPIVKMKWLFNSKPIIFEDKHILKLMNIQQRNAGTYKCIATNAHGAVHRQFKVNVSVPPFISEFDILDVTLMKGVNATLECNAKGYPEPNLNWTYNNTNWRLENSTLTATHITEQAEGVYRCDAKNKAGATHIAYRVSVLSKAKVEDIVAFSNGEGVTVGKSLEAALGAHLRVACRSSGKPSPSVQWLRNGQVLSENPQGILYADLTLDVQNSDTGSYTCVVANEGGSDEKTVRLEVLEPPKILQSIFQNDTTIEVLSGQSYYLHCHPLGNPIPQVYWFKDGLPLKLFDDSMVSLDYGEVIEVKSAVETQAGNYTCVARNVVGNDSVTYLIGVLVPPPEPKESSMPVSIRVGKPLTLTCPVEGNPVPNVMWIKHPYTEIGEATPRITLTVDNITMLINHTQVSDSGNYSCIMTNKAGTTEVVYKVTIDKPPSIAGDLPVENHVVALRRSIVLKCEADGHPLPTINWLKDTQKLSETSSNVHRVLGNSLLAVWSVTSRDAGQYICVVENEAGTAHRRYNVAIRVPGKWSSWSQWSLCNVTCGPGLQQRARNCHYIDDNNEIIEKTTKPDKIVLDESACKGPSNDRRKCQMPPCETGSGVWFPWTHWSPCSASCGKGTQARTRKCNDKHCVGDNVQIRKCLDLPKCKSNEDDSGNDVYSKEDSRESAYIPEAVFEKQPEILNSVYSPDEGLYTGGVVTPSDVFYEVNVTQNLDGSDVGVCGPGYRTNEDSCEDIDECEMENNHCHSTQVCENTEGAYRCTCPPGYVSLGAGQRCMDINECSQDTSGCEYACVNTAGGYACACPAHMRLHADKHHCYIVSSHRRPHEDLDPSEYLSTSVEHPARYKHIRNI